MSLNNKQRLFAAEYMKDMNATRAAIRAGYSPRSAYSTGERLLRNAEVAAEVERLMAERIERTGIEADRVIEELERLAFSDLREHVEWGPNFVKLKESAGLTDEAAAAVAVVAKTVSENGASYKIKLHDKLGALRDLAKHLGLFPKDGAAVNVNVNVDNRPVKPLSDLTEEELEFYESILSPDAGEPAPRS